MNTQKLLDLASELECNVVYNEPLSKHTTFRTGGTCTAMVDISSEESLAKLVRAAHEWNVRYIVVGNGSNLLTIRAMREWCSSWVSQWTR